MSYISPLVIHYSHFQDPVWKSRSYTAPRPSYHLPSYRWHAIFLLWATHKLLCTLGVKKLINDFSRKCLTLPLVFSPYCHHPETALLRLESDLQQSTLVQLLEQNGPILSAKLPINCFHSPSPQRVLFQLSNLCFSISMFLLMYIL